MALVCSQIMCNRHYYLIPEHFLFFSFFFFMAELYSLQDLKFPDQGSNPGPSSESTES